MKKQFLLLVFSLFVACGTANAIDLAEIQKLRDMGFTNEQIVEMTKGSAVTAEPVKKMDPVLLQRITSAKQSGKGLLAVWASKEYPDRGPGYLDIFINDNKLGQVPLIEYVTAGPTGVMKTNYVEYGGKKKYNYGTSTSKIANILISRYKDDFELPPGTYEVMLQRSFYVGDPTDGWRFKERLHKKFHNVVVEAGKVTLLSYYWEENEMFGRDIVMSFTHKNVEAEVAESWGEYLRQVVQK